MSTSWTKYDFLALWLIAVSMNFCCSRAEQRSEPPLDLILSNLATTDVTVVLKVDTVDRINEEGVYTTWVIGATIARSIKGTLIAGEHITYQRTIETGFKPPALSRS